MDTSLSRKIGVVIATIAVGAVAAVIPLVGGGPVRNAPVRRSCSRMPALLLSSLVEPASVRMEAGCRPSLVLPTAVLLADALLRARAAIAGQTAYRRDAEGMLKRSWSMRCASPARTIDVIQHRLHDALKWLEAPAISAGRAWNCSVMGAH
jgi:hypothetical protein